MKIFKTRESRQEFLCVISFAVWLSLIVCIISFVDLLAMFITFVASCVLYYVYMYIIAPVGVRCVAVVSNWVDRGERT